MQCFRLFTGFLLEFEVEAIVAGIYFAFGEVRRRFRFGERVVVFLDLCFCYFESQRLSCSYKEVIIFIIVRNGRE